MTILIVERFEVIVINEGNAKSYFEYAAFPIYDLPSKVRFVEGAGDIRLTGDTSQNETIPSTVFERCKVIGSDERGVLLTGTIVVEQSVYPGNFRVNYDGEIEFMLKKPSATNLDIFREVFRGGYRFMIGP